MQTELTVRITQTVSAYNFAYLEEFSRLGTSTGGHELCLRSRLFKPGCTTPEVRKEIITKYRNGKYGNGVHFSNITGLFENDNWEPAKWEQFCKYNDQLDKQREHPANLTWRTVFPELIELVEKYGFKHEY
jgi:hypothetical protein